jgi:hypothetical protein
LDKEGNRPGKIIEHRLLKCELMRHPKKEPPDSPIFPTFKAAVLNSQICPAAFPEITIDGGGAIKFGA